MDPVDVDECGSVNPDESGRIEAVLQIGDGLVNAMFLAAGDCEGELVLGDEVRNILKNKERDTFADTRGDARRVRGLRLA